MKIEKKMKGDSRLVLEIEADSEQSEDLGEKENSKICHVLRGFGLTPSDQNFFELWIQKLKDSDLDFHLEPS